MEIQSGGIVEVVNFLSFIRNSVSFKRIFSMSWMVSLLLVVGKLEMISRMKDKSAGTWQNR